MPSQFPLWISEYMIIEECNNRNIQPVTELFDDGNKRIAWLFGLSPFCGEGDRMADAGYTLTLKGRGRGQQRTGGTEQKPLPSFLTHAPQQIAVEDGGGAAAVTGTGMHILCLQVEKKHTAVLIIARHINTVLPEQIHENL